MGLRTRGYFTQWRRFIGSELSVDQSMRGGEELRLLGRLYQPNCGKTLDKDSFGVNDALIGWTIRLF